MEKCGDNTTKKNKIIIGTIGFLLILNILVVSASSIGLDKCKSQIDTFEKNNLNIDLKIKGPEEGWLDDSLSTEVNKKIEFKINVETNREYKAVAILVKLPLVGNNPMFNYDWGLLGLGSSKPKPSLANPNCFGDWTANDTDVCWAWLLVDNGWSEEMTFQAITKKTSTKTIELKVYGVKDIHGNIDEAYDSISITVKKDDSKAMLKNHRIFLNFFRTLIIIKLLQFKM